MARPTARGRRTSPLTTRYEKMGPRGIDRVIAELRQQRGVGAVDAVLAGVLADAQGIVVGWRCGLAAVRCGLFHGWP